MKQSKQLALVALYGIVAAVWLALCIREAMTAGEIGGLRVLTTVVFSFCFAIYLGRYLRQ